jgi:hypothetical protein
LHTTLSLSVANTGIMSDLTAMTEDNEECALEVPVERSLVIPQCHRSDTPGDDSYLMEELVDHLGSSASGRATNLVHLQLDRSKLNTLRVIGTAYTTIQVCILKL